MTTMFLDALFSRA